VQTYNDALKKLDPNSFTSVFDIFTSWFNPSPVPAKPCAMPDLPPVYNYYSFNSSATNADMITQENTGYSNATSTL